MLGPRKLLILLMMLILPVQGLAAAYAPMHMAIGARATAAAPCHEQQQHSGHQAADPSADDGATGAEHDTNNASHLCCQQIFTGATCSVLTAAAHKFNDVPRVVFPLVTLFIPDSPDRPPRG